VDGDEMTVEAAGITRDEALRQAAREGANLMPASKPEFVEMRQLRGMSDARWRSAHLAAGVGTGRETTIYQALRDQSWVAAPDSSSWSSVPFNA
jgi:hypothetical protein